MSRVEPVLSFRIFFIFPPSLALFLPGLITKRHGSALATRRSAIVFEYLKYLGLINLKPTSKRKRRLNYSIARVLT